MKLTITLLIFGIFLAAIAGFFLGRKSFKTDGELRFFLQQIDDDGTEVINCSVKPDDDWDKVMYRKKILFRITKEQRIDQLKGEWIK